MNSKDVQSVVRKIRTAVENKLEKNYGEMRELVAKLDSIELRLDAIQKLLEPKTDDG